MNVPSIVRSKLVRGVSLFALCALVGIGYLADEEPLPDLSSKSYFELEGLAEPLFEEIFRDKHGRALEAYTSSKGYLSCDKTCQENKRQLEEAEIELTATLRERLAARRAILAKDRADRLALHESRQAEAAERRAMTTFTGEERISARKLARQAEREADRAAMIAAYRLSLGVSEHPLTLEEKQARAAENLRKRQEARGAIKTPAERAQEADDRQAARWFVYLDEVAQAHGFPGWHFAEQFFDMTFEERMAVREGNQNKSKRVARSDVRAAVRGATHRTPSPTPAPTLPTKVFLSEPVTYDWLLTSADMTPDSPLWGPTAQDYLTVRYCETCAATHQTIVYKRLTPVPDGFDYARMFLNRWTADYNAFNVDFELYSSVEDALAGVNKWIFCDYYNTGVGMCRNCGPTGPVRWNWNGGSAPDRIVYWSKVRNAPGAMLVTPAPTPAPTPLPTPSPTPAPVPVTGF